MYAYLTEIPEQLCNETELITDLNLFVEDILLGCAGVDTVLVKDKNSESSMLLSSIGCIVVTIADLDCHGEVVTIEESEEITVLNVEEMTEIVNSVEPVSKDEKECVGVEEECATAEEEYEYPVDLDVVESLNNKEESIKSIDFTSESYQSSVLNDTPDRVEEDTSEVMEVLSETEQVSNEIPESAEMLEVAVDETPQVTEVMEAEPKVDIIEYCDGSTNEVPVEVVKAIEDIPLDCNDDTLVVKTFEFNQPKKGKVKNLLSRLPFVKNKGDDLIRVEVNEKFATSVNKLKADLTNIKVFKEWLVASGYLTQQDLVNIEREITTYKGRGIDVKFLRVVREMNLMSDATCAEILTKSLKREVKCYADLDMRKIATLTALHNFLRRDCFLLNHVPGSMVVEVGHDIDSPCDIGEIEMYFPGHKILTREFVEGTTSRVVYDIAV